MDIMLLLDDVTMIDDFISVEEDCIDWHIYINCEEYEDE